MDFSPAVSLKRNQLAKSLFHTIVRTDPFGVDAARAADRAMELATAFTARCMGTGDTANADDAAENEALADAAEKEEPAL